MFHVHMDCGTCVPSTDRLASLRNLMNRFYFVPLLGAKLEKCETRTPMIPMPAQFFGKGSKNLAKGTASQQHLSSVDQMFGNRHRSQIEKLTAAEVTRMQTVGPKTKMFGTKTWESSGGMNFGRHTNMRIFEIARTEHKAIAIAEP